MPAKGTVTGKAAHNFKPIAPGTHVHYLTVLGYSGSRRDPFSGKRKGWYNCRCDCGALKQIRATHLRQGLVKSCGCYNRKLQSARSKAAWSLLATVTSTQMNSEPPPESRATRNSSTSAAR